MKQINKLMMTNAIAFCLTFGKMGDKKQIAGSQKDETLKSDEETANPEWLTVTKTLFASPTFDAIKTLDSRTYQWARKWANASSSRRGLYLVTPKGAEIVDGRFSEVLNERRVLVSGFLNEYAALIESAKGNLKGAFNPDNYKSEESARRSFRMDWSFTELNAIPESLSPELKAKATEKLQTELQETGAEIRDGLRVGFAGLVDHLLVMLKPRPDGTVPRFFESNITNMLDFIAALEARDLTNDGELRSLAATAKGIIESAVPANVADLRKSDGLKQNVIQQFAAIESALEPLVGKGRKLKLD